MTLTATPVRRYDPAIRTPDPRNPLSPNENGSAENQTLQISTGLVRAASSVGRDDRDELATRVSLRRKVQEPTPKVGAGIATSNSPNAGRSAQKIGDVVLSVGVFTPSAQKKREGSPKITGDRDHYRSPMRAISEVPFPITPQYTKEQQEVLEQANKLFCEAERFKNEGNTRGSTDKLIERVSLLQNKLPGSLALATAYSDLGSSREKSGDLDKALTCYERARPIFEQKVPDTIELAKFYENFAIICDGLYNIPKALEYYGKSCSILSSLNVRPVDVATVHDKIAHLLEAQGSDASRALELRLTNIPIYEAAYPKTLGLALYYELIASFYEKDKVKEREYLQKCVEIEKNIPLSDFTDTFQKLRKLYEDKGKLEETFSHLMKSFGYASHELPTLVSQASCYTAFSGVRNALVKHTEAINKFEGLLKKKIKLDPKNLIAAAYCEVLGEVYEKLGREEKSVEFYNLLLAIRQCVFGPNDKEVSALGKKIKELPGRIASMSQARNSSVIRAQSVVPAQEKLSPLVKELSEYKSGFFSQNDKDRAAEKLKALLIEYQALDGENKENKYSEISKYVSHELDKGKENPLFSGIITEKLYTFFVRCGRLFPPICIAG